MNNPTLVTTIAPIRVSDHTALTVDSKGWATLAASTTYYYPLGDDAVGSLRSDLNMSSLRRAALERAQVQWDAAAVLTVTIEDTVWVDVTPDSAVGGDWLQQNPTTAYVPTTGGTATSATVAVAGGTAGGCAYDMGNFGGSRMRVKIVVGGTGGSVRVGQCGKAA